MTVPSAPKLTSKSWLLIDFHSGKVLASKDHRRKIPPASLTKIMTSYVIAAELYNGRLTLEEEVFVSRKAWGMKGSRMFLEERSKVTVSDLIKGMVIQSGNDASVALAEHIGGDEAGFARIMNDHAQELGMENTNFVNVTGLSAKKHYTTAEDMAKLIFALIRNYPEHYKLYQIKEFSYNGISQLNRNRLLWRDKTVDGVKTGYTRAAGYCFAASSERDDMRLVAVVFGAKSDAVRMREVQRLFSYGFRYFRTIHLYSPNESLAEVQLYGGVSDQVSAGIEDELYITIPRGTYADWKADLQVVDFFRAPVVEKDNLGSLIVSYKGERKMDVPLVALESVNEGSFFKQFLHYFYFMWNNFLSYLLSLIDIGEAGSEKTSLEGQQLDQEKGEGTDTDNETGEGNETAFKKLFSKGLMWV